MKLILGDCIEKMRKLPDASVDMVLCDPPYGTTACKWDAVIPFEPMWEELKRVSKNNAAICMFGAEPFSSALRMSNLKMFKYDWIWVKNTASGAMLANRMPMRAHEVVSVFYQTQCSFFPQKVRRTENELKRLSRNSTTQTKTDLFGGKLYKSNQSRDRLQWRNPDSALHFNGVFNRSKEKVSHPTQKPVALLEYLIKTYTIEGETVLDFTMGSGSTGVACVNTGRSFIGIERDEKYFEIARTRIQQAKRGLSQLTAEASA